MADVVLDSKNCGQRKETSELFEGPYARKWTSEKIYIYIYVSKGEGKDRGRQVL